MKRFLVTTVVGVLVILFLQSCSHQGHGPIIPVSKLPKVTVKIHRYGKALFGLDTLHFQEGLKKLQKSFPYFLDADLDDTANVNQLYRYVTDTGIAHVYRRTMKVYPDLSKLEKQLSSAFSHFKYYFPNDALPQVFSYVSDLYFEHPILRRDSVLVIALDDYLGKNYLPYEELNIPEYHRRCMQEPFIPIDVMNSIYSHYFYPSIPPGDVLAKMVNAGKRLYFLDAMMPMVPDSVKIGYTAAEMKWMEKHKKDVWAVLVKDNLLYSTNYMTMNKLTQPGPFSDGFSNDSPAAMGNWFGWQIVRRYMSKYPKTTLLQLMKMGDPQSILQKSGYKP
jgi:hypothetical protein